MFAEVNADILTFMKKKDGSIEKIIGSSLVGQKISTKSVGSDRREDITHLYKYPEGTRHCGIDEMQFRNMFHNMAGNVI